MSVTHLATRKATLCDSKARFPSLANDLTAVTCKRCGNRFEDLNYQGSREALERRLRERQEKAVRAIGLGVVWDRLAGSELPSEQLVLDLLGTIANGLIEMGLIDNQPQS